MSKLFRVFQFSLISVILVIPEVCAQSPNTVCMVSATPLIVRAEGVAERVGDITYNCSGQPRTQVTVNLTIALNVNITNRLSSGNTLTGIIFTIDTGSGPQAVTAAPLLMGPGSLAYNGVNFTLSAASGTSGAGTAVLNIKNIRGNATQVGPNGALTASLAVSNSALLLNTAYVKVGTALTALYASQASRLVCAPNGSKLPDTIAFSTLIGSGAVFASTRLTEGFADAFHPRGGYANLNADSGERILVNYSGFPQGARLFVPDVVAGSDAVTPTAGGDFGLAASGGAYAPSGRGSLLLARVSGADANGAGGAVVFTPGGGSGTTTFDTVSELQITNGSAFVVYEVIDADPNGIESAQFPTFLGSPVISGGNAVITTEAISLAPVSKASIATSTDPIPRSITQTPPPDCTIVGDCSASYLPQLSVQTYNEFAGGGAKPNLLLIHNLGSGVMQWTVTATYPPGTPTGWLQPSPAQGINNATVRVGTVDVGLQPGTYQATLIVDAGPLAGKQSVPVTFMVVPTPPPTVRVNGVVNAASFAAVPVVPGSLVSVLGSGFTGKSIAVTFDGMPATILYSDITQINLLVPTDLPMGTSKLIVTVDGVSSTPLTVQVAQFAPAIFKGAVLNQDWTVNDVNNAAMVGSILQIYATGLSGKGTVTGRIGDRVISNPYYAGPAPGYPGVQQIDLQVPSDLPAMTTDVYLCGAPVDKPDTLVCSVAAPLTVK